MIAVDTNILIHAHFETMPKHAAACRRLESLAEGREPWALPVFCVGEFLRVATHPRVFETPFEPEEAWHALNRLLASPTLVVLHPEERFLELFEASVVHAGTRGNLVFDAQIAALCREHGVRELLTEDRDFARFEGLTPIQLQA